MKMFEGDCNQPPSVVRFVSVPRCLSFALVAATPSQTKCGSTIMAEFHGVTDSSSRLVKLVEGSNQCLQEAMLGRLDLACFFLEKTDKRTKRMNGSGRSGSAPSSFQTEGIHLLMIRAKEIFRSVSTAPVHQAPQHSKSPWKICQECYGELALHQFVGQIFVAFSVAAVRARCC